MGTGEILSGAGVPPIVFLMGCGTANAGSTLGSLGSAFLAAGSRLVVGTTYPVRSDVAVVFTLSMIRRLWLGYETVPYDLATAALVERRNVRFLSDIRCLMSAGRLAAGRQEPLYERYTQLVRESPSEPMRGNLVGIEAQVLAEEGIIAGIDVPPAEWGIVPYPAMFSVLGFPWTTLMDERNDDAIH